MRRAVWKILDRAVNRMLGVWLWCDRTVTRLQPRVERDLRDSSNQCACETFKQIDRKEER
jgi:hypothetical protein